jgi:diguanylate cyclase (GGDEF)-like protein/PAS domain S-box-containing protein
VTPAAGPARPTQALYVTALRLRDLLLVVLIGVTLAVPDDGPRHWVVAGLIAFAVLPYNRLLLHRLTRTGQVPRYLACADQVICAGFALVWADLAPGAMVASMLGVGMAAVMVDRRAAQQGALVGGLLYLGGTVAWLLLGQAPTKGHLLAVACFAVSAFATAHVVGTVSQLHRDGQEQLSQLLDALEVVIYEMDAETLEVRYLSPYVTTITGRPVEDYLGDPSAFLALVHRRDSVRLLEMVGAAAGGRRSYDLQYRIFDAQGRQRWVRNIAAVETGPDGRPLIRGSIADITLQKDAEAALAVQARSDGLTGLANRAQLLTELGTAADCPRLLVFLDLDSFKRINDSLGHSAGDALLVQVAERLPSVLRPQDVVARLGGDEFVVLLDLADERDAEPVVHRVQQAFDEPFSLSGRTVRVTTSAGGVVVPPGPSPIPESLLEQADAAMYAAKRSGPGRSAFFTAAMRDDALERLDVESEIRAALALAQFHLVYQPIVDARTRSVVGQEALVRWEHPVRGLVPPDEFIPIAEQSGQIVELGRWVLREACAQARRWRDGHGCDRTMSVNLSALQLSDPDLVGDVAAALAESGLEPSSLILEITETALIAHPDQALTALHALRATGVQIALDDFGTGYSSLSHLHQYPVDTVKIDRSFVAHLGDGSGQDGVVTAILHLAAHMGLEVVAEGVETLDQADRLAELGCDLLQGYALGRPDRVHAVAVLPTPRSVPQHGGVTA